MTVHYLFLMQGVSGAGKTYQAQKIAEHQDAHGDRTTDIHSADQFPKLYVDGKLQISQLGFAHGWCLRRVIESLSLGSNVIVDNTNLTVAEAAPYVALAQAYFASPMLVRVDCDPSLAFARNVHGVPQKNHEQQVEKLAAFEEPDHWQWIPGYTTETIKAGE